MASHIVELAQIAAKVETTEGTDITPASADAAIWVSNVQFTPTIDSFARTTRSPYFSQVAQVAGKRMGELTFEVDYYGQANTAPGFAVLMQGCAQLGAAVSSTGYKFTPSSTTSNHKSLTISFYEGGRLKKIVGARGTFTLSAQTGGTNRLSFRFMGALVTPADASLLALPTMDANSKLPPAFQGAALSFGGLSAAEALVTSYTLDAGQTLTMRTDANSTSGYRSCAITARRPTLTINIEMPTVAEFDLHSAVTGNTLAAFTFTAGSSTAAVKVDAPKLQIVGYTEESNANGLLYSTLTCVPAIDAGDDEWTITGGV